jgi:hypothetical protein
MFLITGYQSFLHRNLTVKINFFLQISQLEYLETGFSDTGWGDILLTTNSPMYFFLIYFHFVYMFSVWCLVLGPVMFS